MLVVEFNCLYKNRTWETRQVEIPIPNVGLEAYPKYLQDMIVFKAARKVLMKTDKKLQQCVAVHDYIWHQKDKE